MIHTVTMTYSQVTKEMMQDFIHQTGTLLINQERYTWLNTKYKKQGVVITGKTKVVIESTGRRLYFNTLICRVNLRRIIDQENHVKVFSMQDNDRMVQAFDEIMSELQLPPWHLWTANRVDYCVDVRTPYVKEYIHLLQKGDIPIHQKISYDKISRNNCHKPGSLYLPAKVRDRRSKKTGSITINFYDKLREKTDKGDDPALQDQAKDILRLEVQCHKPKLDYLKRKYKFDDKKIYNFVNENVCNDVIESALLKVTRKGDYYRRSEALKVVDSSRFHKHTKDMLKLVLNTVSAQKQSIAKARVKLTDQGMTKDQFTDYLRKLDQLNINPVMISDNQKIPGKGVKDGLKNLYDLFFDAFYDEVAGEVAVDDPVISVD